MPRKSPSLHNDHQAEKLLIDTQLELSTELAVFEHTLRRFNTSFTMSGTDIDVPDSRVYCKCPGDIE
jgi:hypothetical protein